MFKVTIHMVASFDGYIAKNDNDISWFDTQDFYEKGIEMPNSEEFLKTIDCYVMGSKTYEHALELSKNYGWAYGDKPTFVLSKRTLKNERANIFFFNGELDEFIEHHLKPKYNNVWVVGGASLCKDFIKQNLVNEIRLNILPIILGDGLSLFDKLGVERQLHVKESLAFKNGMIELCYELKKK